MILFQSDSFKPLPTSKLNDIELADLKEQIQEVIIHTNQDLDLYHLLGISRSNGQGYTQKLIENFKKKCK